MPFLGLLPWHMEVPRLGVQSELLPPAYATATAMPDLSHICWNSEAGGQGGSGLALAAAEAFFASRPSSLPPAHTHPNVQL